MKEGQIEEGSAAWEAMSAADRTKRKRAAAESRTKLKSPNFFVSRTRLCLRNLPHQISEKALKDLVIAAVGHMLPLPNLTCLAHFLSCVSQHSPMRRYIDIAYLPSFLNEVHLSHKSMCRTEQRWNRSGRCDKDVFPKVKMRHDLYR